MSTTDGTASAEAIERADDGLGDIELTDGPWSLEDAPPGTEFIDFGALQLPAIAGIKARVEIDAKVRKVGGVSVLVNDCAVQLQVVAARAGKPLWPHVRRALIAGLQKGAGHQHVQDGRYGAEVIAQLTFRKASGLTQDVPMRFVGVDGDKWMLRAVVTGPSVLSDATVDRVDALISHVAVNRGSDARAEGEVIELSPPPGQIDFESMPRSDVSPEGFAS